MLANLCSPREGAARRKRTRIEGGHSRGVMGGRSPHAAARAHVWGDGVRTQCGARVLVLAGPPARLLAPPTSRARRSWELGGGRGKPWNMSTRPSAHFSQTDHLVVRRIPQERLVDSELARGRRCPKGCYHGRVRATRRCHDFPSWAPSWCAPLRRRAVVLYCVPHLPPTRLPAAHTHQRARALHKRGWTTAWHLFFQ